MGHQRRPAGGAGGTAGPVRPGRRGLRLPGGGRDERPYVLRRNAPVPLPVPEEPPDGQVRRRDHRGAGPADPGGLPAGQGRVSGLHPAGPGQRGRAGRLHHRGPVPVCEALGGPGGSDPAPGSHGRGSPSLRRQFRAGEAGDAGVCEEAQGLRHEHSRGRRGRIRGSGAHGASSEKRGLRPYLYVQSLDRRTGLCSKTAGGAGRGRHALSPVQQMPCAPGRPRLRLLGESPAGPFHGSEFPESREKGPAAEKGGGHRRRTCRYDGCYHGGPTRPCRDAL